MKKINSIPFILLLLVSCSASPAVPVTFVQTQGIEPVTTQVPVAQQPPKKIPILMYHYVRDVDKTKDPLGYNLSITSDEFAKQMQWLADNHYATVTPEQIANGTVPDNPIWLTFDDGYEDFYTAALPVLSKFHFTATEAIIVDKIGEPSFMNENEIIEIVKDGNALASHTFSHLDLTKASLKALQNEIVESKKVLEDRFHTSVSTFVYPSGKYNDAVKAVVKGAGYHYALTTKQGVGDFSSSRLDLKRIRVDNRVVFDAFVKEVSEVK